ncbi:MAG: single-stranded DNA-binding protein [Candidatus Thiodiazotropha taylori]|uniref:Single-stranded DNA-binding protein n=1 Tax=Candidatus Thiodiazotropha taylori TaxID=2792791 RepID=A0A9E4N2J8_9GAMM|nr:single-stranded DNA-binding protein [Candidatus Thiodiazotropha taylori]MCW4254978.1 single-stranded DNA-binding protein [Candidatus Thiodiazotropha taylori]
MSSFSDYLKNREQSFSNLTQSVKETTENRSNQDDRIWKPKMGADGTGYAVVRFLPGKDFTKTPWVRMYSHGFQGPTGKWFIENSLTTLGQKDPVSEFNSRLWNNGTEAGKEQARKQKRRTSYYANVLVLKDPINPANEGKVMIYQFGQKIFEKLTESMQPQYGEEPVNPFDPIDGANFRIKIKTVAGYWNYDSSDFAPAAALTEDEAKLEVVFNAQHDIHDLVAPHNFKTYEELQAKLDETMGVQNDPVQTQVKEAESFAEQLDDEIPEFSSKPAPTTVADDDEAELADFFKGLQS